MLAILSVSVIIIRRHAAVPVRTGEIVSITREGRTVTYVECPECEKSLRVAPDGMSATINLCRLRDGNPDAREFARRQAVLIEWAFLLMKERSRHPGVGKD